MEYPVENFRKFKVSAVSAQAEFSLPKQQVDVTGLSQLQESRSLAATPLPPSVEEHRQGGVEQPCVGGLGTAATGRREGLLTCEPKSPNPDLCTCQELLQSQNNTRQGDQGQRKRRQQGINNDKFFNSLVHKKVWRCSHILSLP